MSIQAIAQWFGNELGDDFNLSVVHSEFDDAFEIRIMPKRYMRLTVTADDLRAGPREMMKALRREAAKAKQWKRDGFKVPRRKKAKP
jgi:hypothetical protein